ncbi:helix-turn-helix transcriptional regulator [Luteipulveratus mongoliensis]|uniref:HTH luxR-type domain-containing protein n=1 Tax=Luteipulveratus mongoliensis TaxID=571913 RepID=A0A0K1JD73_9MICO|nr:HTH domain-containing protein [Luteipulveratus mongoliensis]AKU14649.1 hypothetical protein VV02_00145 [Luteipulveratus mongoliensis]
MTAHLRDLVSADAEAMYLALLAGGDMSLSELADRLDLDEGAADGLVADLERVGLVLVRGGVLSAQSPRSAVEAWALTRKAEEARAWQGAEALAQLYSAGAGSGVDWVEVVRGKVAGRRAFANLQSCAVSEVRAFDRGPYLTDIGETIADGQSEALERAVAYRVIYDSEVLQSPARLAVARDSIALGEEARVFPGLPMKLFLADGDRGLIALPHASRGTMDSLIIRPSVLLDALSQLFEAFWRMAVPLSTDAPADTGDELAARSEDLRDVLVRLSIGLTDDAIARELGISERTVHRRVRRLQELLGAQTRFQLGIQATRRGWL